MPRLLHAIRSFVWGPRELGADPGPRLRIAYLSGMVLIAAFAIDTFGVPHMAGVRHLAGEHLVSMAERQSTLATRMQAQCERVSLAESERELSDELSRLRSTAAEMRHGEAVFSDRTQTAPKNERGSAVGYTRTVAPIVAALLESVDDLEHARPHERYETAARATRIATDVAERAHAAAQSMANASAEARSRHQREQVAGVWTLAAMMGIAAVVVFEPTVRRLSRQMRELGEKTRAAKAADRARSLFLQNMSHEVWTPMMGVLGYADLLLDPGLTPSQRSEHVESIRRAATRLDQLMRSLLNMAALETGDIALARRQDSLPKLMNAMLSRMHPLAAVKGLQLSLEYATPVPEAITTDHERLSQILGNLIENGIKHSAEGHVLVRVSYDAALAWPLRFDIVDTGPGIAADRVKDLFEPFFQADASSTRTVEGAGLGLPIARGFARRLGGDVQWFPNPTGQGSVFTAWVVPGVEDDAAMLPPSSSQVSTASRSVTEGAPVSLRGRVLLAEDSPDNQRLIAHHLKSLGLEYETVENGKQAVDRALAAAYQGRAFDVILMDMQMPVLDGYGATSLLRQSGYTSPIVALTAHANIGDKERCLGAGCDDHLPKPIDRFGLAKALGRYLAGDEARDGAASSVPVRHAA